MCLQQVNFLQISQFILYKRQLCSEFRYLLNLTNLLSKSEMLQKPGTPSSMPTKSAIFNWIKQIAPDTNKMKVQDLGDGVIYCKIMNHYFPGCINLNRLNINPKNQYDYSLNLKLFQNALTVHKVVIPLDVGKVAKQKFLQNWGLINALYRHFLFSHEESVFAQDSKSLLFNGSKFTPKRSFQLAFHGEQYHKPTEIQTFIKPIYTNQSSQVHMQSNQFDISQNIEVSQPQHDQNKTAQTISQNILMPTKQQKNTSQALWNSKVFLMNKNQLGLELVNSLTVKSTKFDHQASSKCWSVGKLPINESNGVANSICQENFGKYSVNSHIFQNNYNAVIDRVKQILLKNSHDIQKIRQIKILLNIAPNDDIVKIQEEQNVIINCLSTQKILQKSAKKQNFLIHVQSDITGKNSTQQLKDNLEKSQIRSQIRSQKRSQKKSEKKIKKFAPIWQQKQNKLGMLIQNISQKILKEQKSYLIQKNLQNSGKKIKNNLFGQGVIFKK